MLKLKSSTTFDRSIIKRNWSKINRTPLQTAGAFVARSARQSIRKARKSKTGKVKPSPRGKPPRTRSAGEPLRLIFSVPNTVGTSVIIGPVGFGSAKPTTELHEKGGTATRYIPRSKASKKSNKKRFIRKTVTYPPRPYMKPALDKTRSRLPHLWRNSFQ